MNTETKLYGNDRARFLALDGVLSVCKVRMNGIYEAASGQYFGAGKPIYRATDASGNTFELRADSRSEALLTLKAMAETNKKAA